MKIETQRNLLGLAVFGLGMYVLILRDKLKKEKAGNLSTFNAFKDGSLSYTPQNQKK